MASKALNEIQLVSFFLHNQEYAVDVMAVREIITMTAITKTANAPGHVEGIINLRGAIVPVLSLRKCLSMPESLDRSADCIAIMDLAGELTGLVIDEVSDVMRITRDQILPPQDVVEQPWVQGILNMDQRLVIVMNPAHLIGSHFRGE